MFTQTEECKKPKSALRFILQSTFNTIPEMDYLDNVFVLGGAEEFVKRDQISFQRSCYLTWLCSLFHKLFVQKDKWNGLPY